MRGGTQGGRGGRGRTAADFVVGVAGGAAGTADWSGTVEHLPSRAARCFYSALEMVLLLESKMNTHGFPQPATARRAWGGGWPRGSAGEGEGEVETMQRYESKKIAPARGNPTFFVRIHYRQNSTWQGSIQWLEGRSTRYFRSALEMIMLMQEAIAKSGGQEGAGVEFQSWADEETISS